MKNIYVLPTDKPSRLYLFEERLILGDLVTVVFKNSGAINQNIYITSDEEIKEGDWRLDIRNGNIYKSNKADSELYDNSFRKKIILTDDQDLIKDGIQSIDDDFLEWFVKNPSCEFVETKQIFGIGRVYSAYEIIIPKEEPKQSIQEYEQQGLEKYSSELKQETLEEFAKQEAVKFYKNGGSFTDLIILGAKWQQEQDKKMYSEEEVINILNEYGYAIINEDKINSIGTIKKWFEKFKNK